MKSIHRIILLTALFIALITIYFLTRSPASSADSIIAPASHATSPLTTKDHALSSPTVPPHAPSPPTPDKPPADHLPTQVRFPAGKPLPEIFPHQAERDSIQSLATTYDPKVIPKIAAYLNNSDETVRAAAVNALIQIGSPDAIPYLKAAQSSAGTDEADRLRETIEFLSLPVAKTGK